MILFSWFAVVQSVHMACSEGSLVEKSCWLRDVCVRGVDGVLLGVMKETMSDVLAHTGSYESSPRVQIQGIVKKDPAWGQVEQPTLLLRAANPMYWHWLGDELFSGVWLQKKYGLPKAHTRVLLLEPPSAFAHRFNETLSRGGSILLAGPARRAGVTDTPYENIDGTVCFKDLYVGVGARQLGGPGQKSVTKGDLEQFIAYILDAYGVEETVPEEDVPMSIVDTPHLLVMDVRTQDRRILNAGAVRVALEEMVGANRVRVVSLSTMPRAEQLALIRQTAVFVSVHGSGMANAMWLQDGAQVVELFPFGFRRPTYEYLLSGRLPQRVQYNAWQNRYRDAAVFHPEILDRGGLHGAARDAIEKADAFAYTMPWLGNLYWVNQDLVLPTDPESDLMQMIARLCPKDHLRDEL